MSRFVWPWAKWRSLCHDSFHCRRYGRSAGFPTRRREGERNNFVASVFNNKPVLREECPEKCRPLQHKDWKTC